MIDAENTLTTPLPACASDAAAMLGLTILWHPENERIGEQFIAPSAAGALELNRFSPLFRTPGGDGLALGHRCVSRAPLAIAWEAGGGVSVAAPDSRMAVDINGRRAKATTRLSKAELERGVVLGLGGMILLCVHPMRALPRHNDVPGLLGVGGGAIALREQIGQAAATDLPVLLLGETGTGKEVAAQAIHAAGARRARPFVAVNMAALPESLAAADLFGAARGAYTGAQAARGGLFAEAGDGTLFLDEIGDTPPLVQPMLLRVLENGEYRPLGAGATLRARARLITATDRDLHAHAFNPALLRRLEGYTIRLPPLRERREDIGVLLRHFAREACAPALAPVALPFAFVSAACNSDWPGNIRQLAHAVRRAVIAVRAGQAPPAPDPDPAGTHGGDDDAPDAIGAAPAAGKAPRRRLDALTDDEVLRAMEDNGWRILGAAAQLGISRPSLYKLLETHPLIRRAEAIPAPELRAAVAEHGPDVDRCASRLRTPGEALRRHLRANGLI
nr:sigma 54-interacting transcriptional regulator [uncultured Duganella sp.]